MVHQVSKEERELIDLFNKMPISDRQKKSWEKRIRENGIEEEFLETVRKKIKSLQKDKELDWNGTLVSTELVRIVKRWRLSKQTRTFNKRRF